eukprot:TRINITY_DN72529_c0_g1_i1.p1 TRINITY_DN72529_c0_g1~~TRINITY_DN72529_c0_g1_i1.p1  ORF type:complete len:722 (+),score=56.68 TRINITY_DN72529_c0_g1_i1:127-2292(+)
MSRCHVHRTFNVSLMLSFIGCELSKMVWNRWCDLNRGYSWVRADGFSVDGYNLLGVLCMLVIFVLVLEAVVEVMGSSVFALVLHGFVSLIVALLAIGDVALYTLAGGARISIPLVLFVLGEPSYTFTVVRPWISAASVASFCLIVGAFATNVHAIRGVARRCITQRHFSRSGRLASLAVAVAYLTQNRSCLDSTSLLGQLVVDLHALCMGSFPDAQFEAKLAAHSIEDVDDVVDAAALGTEKREYPPMLLFHWEAATHWLLHPSLNCSVTPFLCSSLRRDDVVSVDNFYVTMPLTMKTAWEALCGTSAALSADFREHGSILRRQCLPRFLARCCGYVTILAKTDATLPELPRRVFGFTETIQADNSTVLLSMLRTRLEDLQASRVKSRRPVFVYYYADDAHSPYPAHKVSTLERGYSSHLAEDVFLALQRRTDDVARRLSEFFPPPAAEGQPWKPEHGFTFYFGDHGEELLGRSTGTAEVPHGHVVSKNATAVMVVFEQRAFASRGPSTLLRSASQDGQQHQKLQLRRPADIFSTILELIGKRAVGELNIGKSLFGAGHDSLASFSFYRPGEVAAVHHVMSPCGDSSECVRSVELQLGAAGWKSQHSAGCQRVRIVSNRSSTFVPADLANCSFASKPLIKTEAADTQCGSSLDSSLATILESKLQERERVNMLLTSSNLYASWALAKLALAASYVKAAFKFVIRAGSFMIRHFAVGLLDAA